MASGDIELGSRELLENATALLLTGLPPGWARLRADCAPPTIEVTVTMADGRTLPVPASAQVVMLFSEHQRRSADRGTPWRRLVIECDATGELSAYTDADAEGNSSGRVRWVPWTLAVLAVCLLTAAGVVFMTGWRLGPPPRVDLAALPDPPARQRQAVKVITPWFEAENRADVAALHALLCADPSPAVLRWIETIGRLGQNDRIAYPDAVTGFRDEGPRVWVQIAVRLRPVSESQKRAVEQAQASGGFFDDQFTLTDEAGQLKICDIAGILE